MAIIDIKRTVSLDGAIMPVALEGTLYGGENQAHRFIINATKDGAALNLSGTVTASFLRKADDAEVVLTGEIIGGGAAVTLAQSCYTQPGRFELTIFLTQSGSKTALYSCNGNVRNTSASEIVDPGHVVPDISDIVAEYERMQAASDAAEAAAESATEAATQNVKDAYANTDLNVTGRGYQTLRAVNFADNVIEGKYMRVVSSSDAAHATEDTASGWSIHEYQFGQRMVFRVEALSKNTAIGGAPSIMAARRTTTYPAEDGGQTVTEYFSIDLDRVGATFIADAIRVNYNPSLGYSFNDISISYSENRNFEDIVVVGNHLSEADSIVAFGDSIFAGYNASNRGVITQLGELLSLPVTNLAISNATLSNAAPRPSTDAGSVVDQVAAYISDQANRGKKPLYLINGGTNDQYHHRLTDLGTYTDGVNGIYDTIYGATYKIINDLLGFGAQPWQIVVTTPIPKDIRNSTAEHVAEIDAQLTAIGAAMYDIGAAMMVNVINGYGGVFDNLTDANAMQLLMPDNTHPSQYGAKLYAERIFRLLGAANQQEVTELKSAIVQDQTDVVTLESGTYADVDGMHKSTNSARIRCARPLPVKGLESITIPDGYQVWFFRLGIDFTLISTYGSWLSGKINTSLIKTSGTQFLTFAIKNTSTPSSDISSQVNTVQNGMIYIRDMDVLKTEIKSIPQENLAFAERVLPTNLFDYTSEDMCKPGWWYYDTIIGNVVSAKTSGSTKHYVAIKVPVYDSTKITLGIYPNDNARLVYWVGAVDADMRLIAYSIVNQNAPVTYDLPTGAVYFLASYGLGSANFETYLPRVMAVNADAITGYSAYFKPYYKLLDCKTDVDDSESITNLQSIVGSDENSVTLELPDKYDLVVGDTFQLFFKGIINAVNPEVYYMLVDCAKGNAYSRYFEVTPDSAGNITATFTLFGINHNVLDTKTVTLAVHAKPSSPASTKNVLCVGDSLTTAGQWVEEFHRRLTGSGGTPVGDNLSNVNFIGTRVSNNVHYEGYGGWTIRSYNSENVSFNVREITCTHDKTEATDQHSVYRGPDGVLWKLETIRSDTIKIIAVSGEGRNFPNSGTLTWVSGGTNHSDIVYTAQQMAAGNPFWDSTANKVDFSKYANSLGISSIDYVYVLIGWNSASWSESDYKADVQTFIDNVHASFPNAVIVFSGLEIPAQDGLGNNYGATGTYSRYYDLMQFVFNLDKWYAEVAEVNSNTYSYNLSGQFDTEYNMLTATRPANTRNSTEVTYQSNGVHPALSGQMQIADAAYRDIAARL